jgi:HNH endonuclease
MTYDMSCGFQFIIGALCDRRSHRDPPADRLSAAGRLVAPRLENCSSRAVSSAANSLEIDHATNVSLKMAGRKPTSAQVRFEEKVGPPDKNGCRLWLSGRTANGYGLFWFDGQMRPAHRWLLEQKVGKLPSDIDACHSCDVRLCVELSHLFSGTRTENMQDAKRKGRTSHAPRTVGEDHPMSILTERKVLAIRKAFDRGVSMRALSNKFGVSFQTISRTVRRISWSHL